MRKQPKQQRSKQAVNSLVDATAQVIAERGLDQTTTNHIAAAAGVSVGSLYQYFENKDDLIEAVLVQVARELANAVDDRLGELMDADVKTVVTGLLTAVMAAMADREGLYLELARNWNQLHSLTVVNALEDHMMEACRRYILRNPARMQPTDNLPATLFVVINSTLFTVIRYMSQPNPPITQQELIETLGGMIAAFAHNQTHA